MAQSDDFVDPLVEEILGDAADKFFNERRSLEYQLELFEAYLKELKIKKRSVERRAATLNALLLDEVTATEFYERLGIENGSRLAGIGSAKSDLPVLHIPFAFTAGGRYQKLVLEVYGHLQQICREYLHGRSDGASGGSGRNSEGIVAYYGLVKTMAEILNREIKRVNCNMTPSCTLQFAKGLASDLGDKQKITGAAGSEYSSLDEKMRYSALDLKSDGIEAYPEIPPREEVAGAIRNFCRKLYRRRSEEVERTLAKLSQSSKDFSGR